MSATLITAGTNPEFVPANPLKEQSTPDDQPMSAEQARRLEEKLDRVLEALPTIDALGRVLVNRQTAVERTGMSKNTLNGKSAFEEMGKRKTYIEISEIAVIKQRKRRK